MARPKTHGLVGKNNPHPLYRLFYNIKTRCYNASNHNYPFYQGKGIKVCDEWLDNVKTFYDWAINNGWEKGLSIDRIDSSKDYSPDNCRFITISENSKNAISNSKNVIRRFSKLTIDQVIEIKKQLITGIMGTEIAKKFNVHKSCIYKIKKNKRWNEIEIPNS